MLKFIKHTMDTIVGIEIFPIISFLIFFTFFTFFIGLLIYVKRLSKSHVETMGALPFESEEISSTSKSTSND